MDISPTGEIYQIADELRSIANLGLRFSADPYDRERYDRVLSASARLVAALDERSPEEVLVQFKDNLGHISPNAGSNAAVFRDGRVLLVRREDDGLWALPGGLVDVGEPLAEAAQRELLEEANVRAIPIQFLGIWDSRSVRGRTKAQMYWAVFLVEAEPGEPESGPETTDVGFFPEDDLPALTPGHHVVVPMVFKMHRGEIAAPYFDAPGRSQVEGG